MDLPEQRLNVAKDLIVVDQCDDYTETSDIVKFIGKSSETSSIDTSITDGEDFVFDTNAFQKKLTIPAFMKLSKPKDVGKFVKLNEHGWIEEKKILDKISPNECDIESFIRSTDFKAVSKRDLRSKYNTTVKLNHKNN